MENCKKQESSLWKSKIMNYAYSKNNYKVIDIDNKSKICIIFFSSNGIYYPNTEKEFKQKIVIQDKYDWENIAKSKRLMRYAGRFIFVRDVYKQWYVTGINKQQKTVDKTFEHLKNLVQGYEVITAGSSAGGYAAVIFGIKLGAKRIYSFSGQFSLESEIDGYYWLRKYKSYKDYSQYYELYEMIKNNNQIPIYYFYPAKCTHIGGEPLPYKLLSTLQLNTHARLYNMYGPTETTIWSTISELTNKNYINIGNPIEGTRIFIVDEKLNPLPEGSTGEICVAGKGLAKGYINNPLLTDERFIELSAPINDRVYRTGDYGKFENGVYICNGRKDNQVKIRGYRVELEEIEYAINEVDNVDHAVVGLIDQDQYGEALIAFYTSRTSIEESVFKRQLGKTLPNYMIPSIYVKLENIPYTSNGKINRKQIITSYTKMCEIKKINGILDEPQIAQGESLEEKILNIIAENSDRYEKIDPQSDFSSLGLDSITFIKIIVSLEEKFKFVFDDEMLLFTAFSDVNSMISYVKSKIVR